MSVHAVKPLRAAKPVIQDQAPSSEKIRYITRDASGVNVQQQDWYCEIRGGQGSHTRTSPPICICFHC